MSAGLRYEALLPIGTGGMATVYVGRPVGSEGLSHLVALKKAHSYLRSDGQLVESMKLEARLASRLHHPNIVSVLDVEETDGDLVLVLDYVEGCTLRTLLSKLEQLGERRPREIVRIILDVAAGLHAAHQATDEDGRLLGLVHRDISPSNVLVGVDGISRLSDFGIAKALFEGSDRTEAGVLKGKSSYMAPEYVLHQHANAASDLFSLAVVTWEALADARLFKGASEIETLQRVIRADIRPLSDERPELAPLDLALAKALSRLPSDRQPSVEHFASELEEVARRNDLVATHAEVSALVQRVAKAELEDRRRTLLANADSDAKTVVASVPGLPTPDELATAILAETNLPPPSRDLSDPRPSMDARTSVALWAAPAPSARTSASVPARTSVAQPAPVPTRTSGAPPTAAQTIGSAAARASALQDRRRRRAKELLALAGACALFVLALTAMAIQLENIAPIEEAPIVTPSTRPSEPAAADDAAAASMTAHPSLLDGGTLLSGEADAASSYEIPDAAAPAPARSSGRAHPRAWATTKKSAGR
jgi:serine/threonine-protein kinase